MKSVFFQNVCLMDDAELGRRYDVGCRQGKISFVAPTGNGDAPHSYDRLIEGRGRLLTSAFYNTHCHAAMTLFRGLGADLPLHRWLDDVIFPAERTLTAETVYIGTKLAIAEMLRAGIVSFSDMYFFTDAVAKAVAETGIKANLARSVAIADPDADLKNDPQIKESISLFKQWNGFDGGRILVDMSLHAEYTNSEKSVSFLSALAGEYGTGMQIHLSETEKEHRECIERNGCTPTLFFLRNGTFEAPTTAAHGVFLTDEDREVLVAKGVTVSHNPVSNLKLGSGIMPLYKTLASGVSVAMGTDGVASNDRLDILREMQTALLLHKGTSPDGMALTAESMWVLGSENGAKAQRRQKAGRVQKGYSADLLLWDLSGVRNLPARDAFSTMMYSAARDDLYLTMVEGHILYENGVLLTIDEEKLTDEFLRIVR